MIDTLFKKTVETRGTRIADLKAKGKKVVGVLGAGFVPEELIYAADAVPVRFIRGGDYEAVEASIPYVSRFLSTFARAQFGYYVANVEPTYQMVDFIVGEVSYVDMGRLMDLFEYFTEVPVQPFGVPNKRTKDHNFDFYFTRLTQLRDKLHELTGEKITDEKLMEYIKLYNEMRGLLEKISYLRKSETPPISGLDFIKLNHCTFCADPKFIVEELRKIYNALKEKKESAYQEGSPRILLLGCPIGIGDYDLPKLIEELGGAIVMEVLDFGLREYWTKVKSNGDPLKNLAERYFLDRLPIPYQRPEVFGRRIKFFENLAREFKVDGIVWHQLLYEEAYSHESYLMEKRAKELGIPFLKIGSEYDISKKLEAVRTRVETFIETIKRR